MKYAIVYFLLHFTINSSGQDSSLMIAWNKLGNQFLYRIQVFENFGSYIAKTRSIDTTHLNSLKKLKLTLVEKLSQTTSFDSLYIKDIKVLNKKVIGFLPTLLNSIEKNSSFISSEEFKDLQSSLQNAENRIFIAQKQYNEICAKTNRTDLLYKKGD